jgi:hypothetical protein
MHYAFLLSAYLTTASFLREMDPGISTRPVAVPGGPIHIPKRTGAVAAFELSMVFVEGYDNNHAGLLEWNISVLSVWEDKRVRKKKM